MKQYLPFIIVLMGWQTALGQTQCEKVLADGKDLYKKGRFDDALNLFWAALVSCQSENKTDEVNEWLKKTQNAYIAELDKRIANEQLALDKALVAKKAAEEARAAEATARQDAERNAALARKNGKKAEARLMAIHADIVRAKGHYTDALLLAYLGLRLSEDEQDKPGMMRAFSDAVRDSFATLIFEGKKPLDRVAVAPQGQFAVAKLNDQSLHLIQVESRTSQQLYAPDKGSLDFVISPKGNFVAAWGNDHVARIWDKNGRAIASLSGHSEALRHVAFSPDESLLATCSRDNTARIWRNDGQLLAVCAGHTGNVYAASFSQDGLFLLTRSSDGSARVWNPKGEQIATVGNQSFYLHDAEIGPENGQFVTAEADGGTRLWASDGKMIGEISRHQGAAKEVLLTPNHNNIISRGNDLALRIKDLKTQQVTELMHPSPILGMALNEDGSRLLTWTEDQTIWLWDVKGQKLQSLTGHKSRVLSATFARNNLIISSSRDGVAKLWDAQANILTEWIINPEHPLPALFLTEGRRILIASPSNQSLALSPLPQDVLQSMEQQLGLDSPLLRDLKKRYGVVFAD